MIRLVDTEEPVERDGTLHFFMASLSQLDPFNFLLDESPGVATPMGCGDIFWDNGAREKRDHFGWARPLRKILKFATKGYLTDRDDLILWPQERDITHRRNRLIGDPDVDTDTRFNWQWLGDDMLKTKGG